MSLSTPEGNRPSSSPSCALHALRYSLGQDPACNLAAGDLKLLVFSQPVQEVEAFLTECDQVLPTFLTRVRAQQKHIEGALRSWDSSGCEQTHFDHVRGSTSSTIGHDHHIHIVRHCGPPGRLHQTSNIQSKCHCRIGPSHRSFRGVQPPSYLYEILLPLFDVVKGRPVDREFLLPLVLKFRQPGSSAVSHAFSNVLFQAGDSFSLLFHA
ncbi:unnamed protein product [Bursaphelenchus xylophilus]|uniref:(pine wood nematode) hypothetical protein n=1 Tax=Bursaphelenchus xylophilus TaxID=6326 RepID=A0A7I8XDU0_BURXY|nr:unnamed protein product [Bursaphelenchus xylophilus]CAG9113234.1 unnamed protein product [Bursaphelenchus xylophilus]